MHGYRRIYFCFLMLLGIESISYSKVNEGFYLGGVMDYGMVKQKSQANIKETRPVDPDDILDMTFDYLESYSAFGGGLILGYLWAPCGEESSWRAGVEGSLRFNNYKHKTFFDAQDAVGVIFMDSLSFPYTYELRGIAGMNFGAEEDLFFYGFLGGVISKVNWSRNESYISPDDPDFIGTPSSPKDTFFPAVRAQKNIMGVQLGVGIEKEIWKKHRIGVEFAYILYADSKLQAIDRSYTADGTLHTYSFNNKINRVSVRYIIPI